MSYSHYFTFRGQRGKTLEYSDKYRKAILECQKIVKRFYNEHGGLSGYIAHTPIGRYASLQVNGKRPDDCETFELPEHFSEAVKNDFGFVKTNRYQYDIVITA